MAISKGDLPVDLQREFAKLRPSPLPAWLKLAELPGITINDHPVGSEEVQLIIAALRKTAVGKHSNFLLLLGDAAEQKSLDAFVCALFDQWRQAGEPAQHRWALAAIGHLGGDLCILRLTPVIRLWPGDSKQKRAIMGLRCLRQIGTDMALSAIHGIAEQVKYRVLQRRAWQFVEEIAQERGMTRAQLEDRIVPTCDLDKLGRRSFDFGSRQFEFILLKDLKPGLRDGNGKVIANLPIPNKKDDPVKAAPAIADWKVFKKKIQELVKLQSYRLSEAMISARRWTVADFNIFMVKHPLMFHLTRTLVFAGFTDFGTIDETFRVTEDRLFENVKEQPYLPGNEITIQIIHPLFLHEEILRPWQDLLADYMIFPVFPQLNRPTYIPELKELKQRRVIRGTDKKIVGTLINRILERSSWLRLVSNASLIAHYKYYPAQNLTAFIRYEGIPLNGLEEPARIADIAFTKGPFQHNSFFQALEEGEPDASLRIKEVDPIVFSEVMLAVESVLKYAV